MASSTIVSTLRGKLVANLQGTHNDNMGPSHKIPEEKMFLAIFNYIEHLYGKIKPKKLFFMAVDGTSPNEELSNGKASPLEQK